jgi:hypothetical protein
VKSDMVWSLSKAACLIAIVIIVGGFAYVSAKEIMNHFSIKNDLLKEEMVRLSENIVSQKVQDSAALLNDRITKLDSSILELVEQRGQQITAVGEVIARLESEIRDVKSNLYVDKEDPEKTMDDTVVYTKDAEGEDFPLAQVFYNPFLEGEDKWTTRSYPIQFKTKLIIAESGDRKDVIAETTMKNDTIEAYRGLDKPLSIESVEWVERSKRWMFNPRLSLGMNVSDEPYPSLGLTWFSYGRTKRDMDWKFLNMGFGYNDNFHLFLAPVEYNLGNHIPIIENLFIGPYIGVNEESDLEYGGLLSLPF